MRLALLPVIVGLCFVQQVSAQQMRYDRLRIHLDATHTIKQLAAMGLEVDHGDYRKGVWFSSDFSQREEQQLTAHGFTYDVLIKDMVSYYAHQNTAQRDAGTPPLGCFNAANHTVPTPVNFTTGSMGGFYTYQEMLNVLDSMHARYPNLITARQVIDTFHSIEGRPLYWLRISNHPDSLQTGKPQILYTALHHAREPAGLTDMVYYVWFLLENYNTNPTVKQLLDNTEMYFVPCVNPDGYIYNETNAPQGGGLWRKNKRDNGDGTLGVDLNRNYGYNWGYDDQGSSPLTNSETYRGTAAFSEPETRAMKWFTEQHRFKIAVNYHTYSNMLIYPWSYEADFFCPDSTTYRGFADLMTRYNHFIHGTSNETVGYLTNGDSDDWMYGEQGTKPKVLSITPEAGADYLGFWPPANQVVNVAKENFDLIYYAQQLLLKYVAVTDLTPNVVTNKQFWFKYSAQRVGLDSTGSYNIFIVSADSNVTSPAPVHTISNPALGAITTDSFFIQLNPNIANQTDFKFIVHVSNGTTFYEDTITKRYIGGDTLYYNNCNSISSFSPTVTWGTTTATYTSAGGSITDSPDGNYIDNTNATIDLNDEIDLTHTDYATLLFNAKWSLEPGYDYLTVQAKTVDADTGWTALCGTYTSVGLNLDNPVDPVYQNAQNNWVQEAIDLDGFRGHLIKLRFELDADQFVNADGFYFDDLTVLGKIHTLDTAVGLLPTAPQNLLHLYPSPATNQVFVRPVLDKAVITIYDQLGRAVIEQPLTDAPVDVSMLPAGVVYLIVTQLGKRQLSKPVVITR